MPKILHIIIAREYSVVTTQLAEALLASGDLVIVHIDQKLSKPEPPKQLSTATNFFQSTPRVNVNRGDFSIVESILNTYYQMRLLISEGDYINILSGEDYPVRPIAEFKKFLSLNAGKDFLNHIPLDETLESTYHDGERNQDFIEKTKWINSEIPSQFFDRMNPKNYHSSNLSNTNFLKFQSEFQKSNLERKILKYLGRFRTFNRIAFKFIELRKTPDHRFYAGSGWFTITSKTMNSILHYYEENKESELISFLKKLRYSDEVFFQTIAMKLELQTLVDSDLRYINWNQADMKGRPNTINGKDIAYIIDSNAFFCRKVDEKSIRLLKETYA